jgi:hypothetical protein
MNIALEEIVTARIMHPIEEFRKSSHAGLQTSKRETFFAAPVLIDVKQSTPTEARFPRALQDLFL